jgi:hypothetical protein
MELDQKTLTGEYSGRTEEARWGMDLPTPHSVDSLDLTRERKQKPVNIFLSELHELGGVHFWKACFGARYYSELVAICILSRPSSRHVDDGDTIEISRFCTRPDRPANTGSWLIAKARNWAVLEGYDEMIAYAGVADNKGVVYSATGFDCPNYDNPGTGGGSGWTSRENRTEVPEYEKRKWIYDLTEMR